MPTVEIYCTASCPYRIRARRLLDAKGVSYRELRVDRSPGLWDEMRARSGRTTVPQIFIGKHHVGGFNDLSLRVGELDQLLAAEE
jgi:glutaredoxin 3